MSGISIFHRQSIPIQAIKDTSNFCTYCATFLEDWEKVIDHLTPHSSGLIGIDSKENLFVACRECNAIKRDNDFFSLDDARKYILPIKSKSGQPKKVAKTCRECSAYLPHGTKMMKYCDSCRKKVRERKIPSEKIIKCKNCGGNFVSLYSWTKFCTEKCLQENYVKNSYITKPCKYCEKEFSSFNKSYKKYCDIKCYRLEKEHQKTLRRP